MGEAEPETGSLRIQPEGADAAPGARGKRDDEADRGSYEGERGSGDVPEVLAGEYCEMAGGAVCQE